MKKIITLLYVLAFSIPMLAQNISISGMVTAEGEELPGAVVSVKERSGVGTTTNLDGQYTIQVQKGETLVFQFLGYESAERKVGSQTQINVELKNSSVLLEDVVITVPYGVARKATFTGSAGVVDGGIIQKSQVSNISKALQGTVAGVQSFSASGQPGSDATIRIRGVGSVNASSDPLYVIDGVPYDGALSSISSADIESITVMKDAASATLYGSRAANGVIMITTKQGNKESAPSIEFSSKFGFSSRARRDYDQLNTNQYMELFWEAVRNERFDSKMKEGLDPHAVAQEAGQYASENLMGIRGIDPCGIANPYPVGADGRLKVGLAPLWNDNWDDALSQNAHYTDINMQVSGGSKNSRYYVSGGYLSDQGYVIESGFKRYTFRANIVSDVRKWLQLGVNVSGSHSIQNYPKQDDSAISNVIMFARSVPGFYPVYQRDRETGAYLNGAKEYDFGNYRATSYARYNLATTMPLDKNEIKRDQASLRSYVLLTPLEGLTFRSSLNIDYNNRNDHYYVNPTFGPASQTGGSSTKANTRTTGMTFNNVLTYSSQFRDIHSIKLMAGHEYYQYNLSDMSGTRTRMVMDGFDEPSAGSSVSGFDGSSDSYKLLSFFGNAEYSLLDKYYVSASVRSDASSRFHPDNRWGTFWSVGVSWRAISEAFIQNFAGQWLSNLTLRTSYGAQGNDNINDYYAYQALFSMETNTGYPGLFFDRMAAPELSWETNLNFNIGLDFGFFDNRLSGTIEYFSRRSKDLLFNLEMVPSTGVSSVRQNIGEVKNDGWEFMLEGYPIHTPNWKWKLGINATTYKNKISSLPSEEMWVGSKKWVKGGSLYDFYMIEWAGVNPDNGDPQWYKFNEAGERVITNDYSSTSSKDKVKVGNSLPKVSGGIQSDLSYKNFSLSALFTYNIGGKIYNSDKLSLMHQGRAGQTWSKEMLNRWTPENRETNIPRLTTSPSSSWTNQSDRFLVDRSFLKLKTVTFAYALPESFLRRISIKNANVFVQAENLFTWTKEQGLDPEQTFDGTTYYRYPSMKTISLGLNIKL